MEYKIAWVFGLICNCIEWDRLLPAIGTVHPGESYKKHASGEISNVKNEKVLENYKRNHTRNVLKKRKEVSS